MLHSVDAMNPSPKTPKTPEGSGQKRPRPDDSFSDLERLDRDELDDVVDEWDDSSAIRRSTKTPIEKTRSA